MSHGTPSLSTILDASVPVLGNRELLEAVAITRGRPILALVLGPRTLDSACIPHLYDVLGSIGSGAFDLFLGPLGPAVAEVGRVAGLLADHGRFDALVPFEASPAATLLAFAAERIWMGPAATLAPLLAADAPDATARALLELLAHAPSDTRPAALSRWWGDLDPRILGQSVRLRRDLEALARRCLEVGGQAAPAAAVQRFTAVEGPDLPLISAECLALGLPIHSPGAGVVLPGGRVLADVARYSPANRRGAPGRAHSAGRGQTTPKAAAPASAAARIACVGRSADAEPRVPGLRRGDGRARRPRLRPRRTPLRDVRPILARRSAE